MTPVVYIDVLFLINFFVNYFLLYITEKVLFLNTKRIRKIIGASLGGIYSCLIFFPELSGMYTFYSKVVFSLIITGQTFGIKKIKLFLRTLAVFYIASFILCGVTFALLFITRGFEGMKIRTNNGVFYFDLPWKVLFFGGGVCFVVMKVIKKLISSQKGAIYKEVKINLMGKSVILTGLVDTGNRLTDSMGNNIIVCEYQSIKNLIGEDLKVFFEKDTYEIDENDLRALTNIRLIPFTSIGNNGGIMKGFVCDSIEVDNIEHKKTTIAIHPGTLSSDCDYKVLLGAGFFQ